MTFQSLLPPTSTEFERAIEEAVAIDAREPPVAPNPNAKLDGYDPFVPWLIWEYGLGEILPYLSDPQRALREGVLWQRLRGTPAALRIAFSWRSLDGVKVYQEDPGQHFASFQIDTGEVAPTEDVDDLIALARLSAPARSRLARIFHGHDLRRFKLDDTTLGAGLISDYSGVWHTDGQTRLSFGRVTTDAAASTDVRVHRGMGTDHFEFAFMPGRFVLSVDEADGERAIPNPYILHSHLFSIANADGVLSEPANFLPRRKFQKAQVVLSDGIILGDTNARTPPIDYLFYDTGEHGISGGLSLSETPAVIRRTRRTEMFDVTRVYQSNEARTYGTEATRETLRCFAFGGRSQFYRLSDTRRRLPPVWWRPPTSADLRDLYRVGVTVGDIERTDACVSDADRFIPASIRRVDARDVANALAVAGASPRLVYLPDNYDPTTEPNRLSELFTDAAYEGQFWQQLYYPEQDWSSVQVLIGATHRSEN